MAVSATPIGTSPATGRRRKTARRIAGGLLWHLTLLAACAFVLFPIVMVFFGSFKSTSEFFKHPYDPPIAWDLTNYRQAWDEANLQNALKNSVISTAFG